MSNSVGATDPDVLRAAADMLVVDSRAEYTASLLLSFLKSSVGAGLACAWSCWTLVVISSFMQLCILDAYIIDLILGLIFLVTACIAIKPEHCSELLLKPPGNKGGMGLMSDRQVIR